MGELRRRGNIWWIRYYVDGRRYEESSKSTLKKEATKLLRRREADADRGLPVGPDIGRVRFDAAAKAVLEDYRLKGHATYDGVERRIRLHLEPFFGGRRMAKITPADIREYKAQRQAPTKGRNGKVKAGAANATINRELSVLKRAYSLAVKDRKLHQAQVPEIEMLPEDNVREGFFERREFEDVRDNLPAAMRGLVTFAYYTGWRVQSEIQPLRWAQVDRDTETIRLEAGTTKNDEPRILPYGALPELADVIERAWQEHQRLRAKGTICPFVFHRKGKEIRSFRKAWEAACRDAGVPGKLLHDFRRTAARNLVRHGVPEKVAMKITGHTTRSVFERYNIVDDGDLRDALGRLAGGTGTEKGQSGDRARVARITDSS